MKQNLLFCAALFAASSAWAAAPSTVFVSGDGLAESAPVECTKLSENNFQAYARLYADQSIVVKDGNGAECELNGNKNGNVNGVYRINIDFGNNSIELKQITYFAMKHCWTGTEFPMNYVGEGTWAGPFTWANLNPRDNRYKFVVRYPRDNDDSYIYGPVNDANDAEPDGTAEYYYMHDTGKKASDNQWDPKWKLAAQYINDNQYLVTATLRGAGLTHSFSEIGEIPGTLTAGGSALTEHAYVSMNKIDDFTFEVFTKLKAGELTLSDGTNEYVIVNNDKIAKEAGSTEIAKDGVYCINVNFASGAASVKEVNAIRFYHLTSFNFVGESLEYKGDGQWSGNVDIPNADDRYRLEMYLDGDIQHWGAKNHTGQRPSNTSLGEAYFHLKRVPWTFWQNEFKFEDSQKGKPQTLNVYLNHPTYTHSFGEFVSTGIEDVTVDENAPVEYYNLQGIRVANPENGIFIRRQGNKTSKVLVK